MDGITKIKRWMNGITKIKRWINGIKIKQWTNEIPLLRLKDERMESHYLDYKMVEWN